MISSEREKPKKPKLLGNPNRELYRPLIQRGKDLHPGARHQLFREVDDSPFALSLGRLCDELVTLLRVPTRREPHHWMQFQPVTTQQGVHEKEVEHTMLKLSDPVWKGLHGDATLITKLSSAEKKKSGETSCESNTSCE